jgi:hypothetical protein
MRKTVARRRENVRDAARRFRLGSATARAPSWQAAGVADAELFMNVQIAVLCDAATDYAGKMNLLGTFDTIVARQLPAVHPQCTVALRIAFDRTEEGKHKVTMNFVDADGRSVMPSIDMPVEVEVPAESIFLSRNFIINIQQMKFDRPGHFAIGVVVDGRLETSIPLHVRLAEDASGGRTG